MYSVTCNLKNRKVFANDLSNSRTLVVLQLLLQSTLILFKYEIWWNHDVFACDVRKNAIFAINKEITL